MFVQVDLDYKAVFKLRRNGSTQCRARGDTSHANVDDTGKVLNDNQLEISQLPGPKMLGRTATFLIICDQHVSDTPIYKER